MTVISWSRGSNNTKNGIWAVATHMTKRNFSRIIPWYGQNNQLWLIFFHFGLRPIVFASFLSREFFPRPMFIALYTSHWPFWRPLWTKQENPLDKLEGEISAAGTNNIAPVVLCGLCCTTPQFSFLHSTVQVVVKTMAFLADKINLKLNPVM